MAIAFLMFYVFSETSVFAHRRTLPCLQLPSLSLRVAPEPPWGALSLPFPLEIHFSRRPCFQAEAGRLPSHVLLCILFLFWTPVTFYLSLEKLLRLCLFLLYFKIFHELLFGARRLCVCVCEKSAPQISYLGVAS